MTRMIRHQQIYKSQRRGVGTLGLLLPNFVFLLAFGGRGILLASTLSVTIKSQDNSFSTNGAGITDHPMKLNEVGDNSKLFFTVVLTVYTPGSRKHVLELFLKWEPMVHKRRFKELVFSPFLFRDRVGKVFVSDYRVSKAHHGGHYLCMLADQHLS